MIGEPAITVAQPVGAKKAGGCPHCNGTGLLFRPQAQVATAPRRMIPFGNETKDALSSRALEHPPWLFVADHRANEWRPPLDRWSLARKHIAHCGRGSAMVLPEGESIDDYRLPSLPLLCGLGWFALVVWAFDWPDAEVNELGRTLISRGLDAVQILGGQAGPVTFAVS